MRHVVSEVVVSRVLPVLLLAGLLAGVLPAAAAEAPQYQGYGCYFDAQEDAAEPAGDLFRLCVNHQEGSPNLALLIRTVANQSPTTDPAWQNDGTVIEVGFDIDDDEVVERVVTITGLTEPAPGAAVAYEVRDVATDEVGCGGTGGVIAGELGISIPRLCFDEADVLRMTAQMAYEVTDGAAVSVDELPDDGDLTLPLDDERTPAPLCDNATVEREGDLAIRRLACGGTITTTDPITQAIAVSQFVFDRASTDVIDPYLGDYAVIARDDDFADALAGSSLSFGQGPLLFTRSPASAAALGEDPDQLHGLTRDELVRVVPRGSTVYLLGGVNALGAGIDEQLAELGYEVVRFAGGSREETAALISAEVDRIVADFAASAAFPDTNMVLIATRSNWPDAVVAGSVGAFWGMPVLLVDRALPVHPATLAALDALRPDYIHVIGGDTVVPGEVARAVRDHAIAGGYGAGRPGEDPNNPMWAAFCGAGNYTCRWGGTSRIETANRVSQLNRDMVNRFGESTPLVPENPQQYAAAIPIGNVDLAGNPVPNFTYVLAASMVSGRFGGAIFIPTEDGNLSDIVKDRLCNTPGSEGFINQVEEVVMVAGTDILPQTFADQIRERVETPCPPPA